MGLFKKQKQLKNEEDVRVEEMGFDAITKEFERIYPNQINPKHYGTLISWKLGGNNPLQGISIYDGGDYWHFVSYGLSELYAKVSEVKEISGYGMEFTFKLKKEDYDDVELELKCICGILQSIARLTFVDGEIFHPFEYLYTGQTMGVDVEQKSNITGFITIPDSDANILDTPNGRVEFVQFIGVTDKELKAILEKKMDVKTLYQKLGSDVTDYHRKSVV